MYIPPAFAKTELNMLHDLIERHSFGLLISQVDGVPFATHLPFLLDRDEGEFGTLVGHTALANPQCAAANDQSVLAIFSGPHTYISPSWYESDNVVPTWNYVAVHAIGKIEIINDSAEVLDIVQRLVNKYERSMPAPWSFDGTTTFAERMVSQITGFRIKIASIEGKWKLSQNQPVERRQKVIDALKSKTDADSIAVADLMKIEIEAT
jgi:transcriptional regulator